MKDLMKLMYPSEDAVSIVTAYFDAAWAIIAPHKEPTVDEALALIAALLEMQSKTLTIGEFLKTSTCGCKPPAPDNWDGETPDKDEKVTLNP